MADASETEPSTRQEHDTGEPEEKKSKSSEPTWSKRFSQNQDRSDVPYWIDDIDDKITPEVRRLLVSYAGIPPDDVREHIYSIREKAWQIRSYPCTGIGLWLNPLLPQTPVYSTILDRIKSGARYLDVGCFIGQDMRQLVADGAPTDNLYAVDIVSHWDLGYEFFRDRDRFSATFIEEDILHFGEDLEALTGLSRPPLPPKSGVAGDNDDDDNDNDKHTKEIEPVKGTIDIINVTHVLHQWDLAKQIQACNNLVSLSRPGTHMVGFQCGSKGNNTIETEHTAKFGADAKSTFWQSPTSWRDMWKNEIEPQTRTQWKCQVDLWRWEDAGWNPRDVAYLGDEVQLLQFVMTRVK